MQILDERTLFLPERPGNKLADTLTNLLADERIALLFLVPGIGDTFRVNGRAVLARDEELLERRAGRREGAEARHPRRRSRRPTRSARRR